MTMIGEEGVDCPFCGDVEPVLAGDVAMALRPRPQRQAEHWLIVPRRHVARLETLRGEETGALMVMLARLLDWRDISQYRLQVNAGREAGQRVEHLHLHVRGR